MGGAGVSIDIPSLLIGKANGKPMGSDIPSFLVGKAIGVPPTPPPPAGRTILNFTNLEPNPDYPYLYFYSFIGNSSSFKLNYYVDGVKYTPQNNKALYIPITCAETVYVDYEFEGRTTGKTFPPSLNIYASSQPLELVGSDSKPSTAKDFYFAHVVVTLYNDAGEQFFWYEDRWVRYIFGSFDVAIPQEKCYTVIDIEIRN